VSGARRAARRRVLAIVAAGRRLATPTDPLGARARQRLPASTGLSPAGVELALGEHLEVAPGDAELAALLDRAGAAAACHVLLSANVCTAPLRALACAVATAPVVALRPSRRDPVVAELLVEALKQDHDFDGEVRLVSSLAPTGGDEVHLYGSDETLATVAATLPPGVSLRAHGTGLGVGLVEADDDLAAVAAALATDVVVFDGKGCLTPRFALVMGPATCAERLATELDAALTEQARQVPRGSLDGAERAALSRYQHLVDSLGQGHWAAHHAVGFDPAPTQLVLPPAARCIHVAPVSAASLERLLAPWATLVTALGCRRDGPLGKRARALCPAARISPAGRMQTPPLDGPVDRRTVVTTAP